MPELPLDVQTRAWLARRHPTVDWSRVAFRRGLPWWARGSRARAMVVPAPFSRRGARVHVRDGVAPDRRLLAHEAFHVLQYQEEGLRWVAAYLLLALRHGTGRAHPLETPAYAAERAEGPVLTARAAAPRRGA